MLAAQILTTLQAVGGFVEFAGDVEEPDLIGAVRVRAQRHQQSARRGELWDP